MAQRCVLYYITDRTQFRGDVDTRRRALLDKMAEAASAGVDYIQLREKDLSARELETLAREVVRVARQASVSTSIATKVLINSRTDIALAVACLLLAVPACMSNNKGKIVGKWSVTGGSALPGGMMPPGTQMIMEYKSDGKFTWTVEANGVSQMVMSGDYSLGMGDNVTWSNLSPLVEGKS